MTPKGAANWNTLRPAPIHVGPYRATPIRARGDLWYWKVTEGGARGRDVSALLPSRWASVEVVTCALRAALGLPKSQLICGAPLRVEMGALHSGGERRQQPRRFTMGHNPRFVDTLCALICSGDVDMARTYFEGWCGHIRWNHLEKRLLKTACSKWELDPAGFGA